jgi:hypothetical protein
MYGLDPSKLHVRFAEDISTQDLASSRVYTLTHSDATGELFLTIGRDVDRKQISGWYTRFMRDEVIARWEMDGDPELHFHCHISGGIILGTASWREAIFRRHLPMVIAAFRYGDNLLFEHHPELDAARVRVHFHDKRKRHDEVESWGQMKDYRFEAEMTHPQSAVE